MQKYTEPVRTMADQCQHKCEPTPENTTPDSSHFLDCPVWTVLLERLR